VLSKKQNSNSTAPLSPAVALSVCSLVLKSVFWAVVLQHVHGAMATSATAVRMLLLLLPLVVAVQPIR
jgi:hypothetical protein